MSKLILYIPVGLLLFIGQCLSTKIEVVSKATSILVKPGYALKEDDSTFNYQGNKYLIVTDEIFDEKGNIISASVAGDVGYSTYTKQDFNKHKNLIDDYSFTNVINVQLIKNDTILVNGSKIITKGIDRLNKAIYYNLKSRDTLYRITYK
ncbi:hypothetical protein [Pedobacter cryoconitis]|uniref:Uncharacterized protein n=1 Tax=Pedobacter cryoconitis TaxID=188932 RepID=A0A7X0MI15_9SPHI|nr:hypothetical protein [Pedobacter cryoconitis]MBB6499699.1 hypothetical protein [Pedobacter cryoconitis]